jgi:hypothetical protein
VTWQPTTDGTVSLVLLKGPSNNIIPLYAVAEKIANTGTYSWTPATDLEPTGDTGYGFQLINDADGTFQWSTQFGISNDGFSGSASGSASASASASATATSFDSASAGNGTYSSTAAAATSYAAPTGYSNSTATFISESTAVGATTLATKTASGASTASASSSIQPSSGAVALGASIGGAFAAIMAAVAAL